MKIIDLDDMCVIKWRLTDVCNYSCSYCIRRPLIKEIHNAQFDFNTCMTAIPDVIRICNELYQLHNKPIKIDLIGGEISVFPKLNKFISLLFSCSPVSKINITTNLSQPIDYYTELVEIADKYNKKISITASFHPEFTQLDCFMEKAKVLHNMLDTSFKCETVITDCNLQVDDFIAKCNEIGCRYMCEEDLLDTNKRGKSVKNYKVGNRYLVTLDDGTEKYFTTRNEVIKTYGEDGIAINTQNCKCTRDYNYVYLEQDKAIPCRWCIPIEEYHVNPTMRDCTAGSCTLCGHMSIYPKEPKLDKINSLT